MKACTAVPVAAIGHVDGELGAVRGDTDLAPDQDEFASRAIKQEDLDAVVKRKHEHRLRAIDEVSGGQLRGARLEERRQRVAHAWPDRKNRARRDVVGKIGRPIERIDGDTKRGFGIEDLRQFGFFRDDRGDRCIVQRAAHQRVGGDIQIDLRVTARIGPTRAAVDAGEGTGCDQVGQFAGRFGEAGDHLNQSISLRGGGGGAAEIRVQRWGLVVHRFVSCGGAPFKEGLCLITRAAGDRCAGRRYETSALSNK
jgi:hypothetical protein